MNRLEHLQKTLEKNILDNFLVKDVEFVVLDYNSSDGLDAWMFQAMAQYIEMGILVYYKTTEPIHYLRSHSRNMAFRLAAGEIVCNLDADNYLGKGFAEYILKEFREKENIFYISTLYKRDVFGRICLNKQDFVATKGYNEALVGYGLEDAELFNRLTDKGLKQQIFYQEEFYEAITHPDEDRISQESMFKNLHSIYLNYIDPYSTEVVILYIDGSFGSGVILDNESMNYNVLDKPCGIKYCMDERFRVTIKDKWKEGMWSDTESEILLDLKDCYHRFDKNREGLYYSCRQYYKVNEPELIVKTVMVVTEALNFFRMKEIMETCKIVNADGFGKGVVYKNFDYTDKIVLS